MTWRRATQSDLPQIKSILQAHRDQTMFARGNLLDHGLDGDAPKAMRIWWDGENLFPISNSGVAFPIGLRHPDWAALRPLLRGVNMNGFLGPKDWVAGLREAMGHADTPLRMLDIEPQFLLALGDLIMPDVTGFSLTPILPGELPRVIGWRTRYLIETMGVSEADAPVQAANEIAAYVSGDSHRVLWHGDTPVAMTGFNARVEDCVQIGGVYTPPALRGRGYARRAVAMHLVEARANGAARSVLTAANEIAARAYIALGYHKIGEFCFCIFAEPQTIA